jgi:23S rRNA pseudouridine2604 synthase
LRINKYLGETGVCSRREADQWIEAGRVSVNGMTAVLGTKVDAGDVVLVDGEPPRSRPQRVYLALNKPVGIECTTERSVPDNVVDFIGHKERIFPIGRLDKDSEGLLLLTNDGDIVNRVLRAEHEHEKEYVVAVDRPLTPDFLAGMADGVPILDTVTNPCRVQQVGRNTFRIVLTQGLNRQIRRMCEHFGYTVRRLQRVRIMHIQLGELPVGRWRNLSPIEIKPLLPPERVRPRLTLKKKKHPPAARDPAQD